MFGGGRCFRGGRQLSGNSLQFEKVKNSTFSKYEIALQEKIDCKRKHLFKFKCKIKVIPFAVCRRFSINWKQFLFCC